MWLAFAYWQKTKVPEKELQRPRRDSAERAQSCAAPHGRAGARPSRHPRLPSRVAGTTSADGNGANPGVAVCGKYDTLLQGGNLGPAPCAGQTGLSPGYEQRSAKRRGPTGRKAAARARVHAAPRASGPDRPRSAPSSVRPSRSHAPHRTLAVPHPPGAALLLFAIRGSVVLTLLLAGAAGALIALAGATLPN